MTVLLDSLMNEIKIKEILQNGKMEDIINLLKTYHLTKIIDHQTKSTVLDLLLIRNDKEILERIKMKEVTEEEMKNFYELKDEDINPGSYRMLQECLLYRSIQQKKSSVFKSLCTPEEVNRDTLFMGPNILETVEKYDRISFLKLILPMILKVDEFWIQTRNKASIKENNKITSMMLSRETYLDLHYKEGYNRLHIAVFDNEPRMIKYILENKYVDEDDGEKIVGTAFSLSYSLKYIDCIKVFEEMKVNVNTFDKKKQTPLHVAIKSGMDDYCEYLVNNIKNVNVADYTGLTLIERAVLGGCEKICEMLLRRGAEFRGKIHISQHYFDNDPDLSSVLKKPCTAKITQEDTLVSLCMKVNGIIYLCLLDTLNKRELNERYDGYNTLLHLAASLLLPNVCSKLLKRGAQVDLLNDNKCTPLLMMCLDHWGIIAQQKREEDLIKTANVLLDHGASINVEDEEGRNLWERATACDSERLLLTLIQCKEKIKFLREPPLTYWFQSRYFTMIAACLNIVPDELLKKWITFDIINISMTFTEINFTLNLLDKSESSIYSKAVEVVLLKAAQIDDEALFLRLLETEISAKNDVKEREPLLHNLLREKRIKYIKYALNSKNVGLLVSKKNKVDQLPLHVCIEKDVPEVLTTLICETKDVNIEDKYGNTALSLLFERISGIREEDVPTMMIHIQMIINKGGNIYNVNKFNKMIITFCENNERRIRIEAFYNRQIQPTKASNDADRMICCICCDNLIDCIFECRHTFCMSCGQRFYVCPMCRHEPTNPKKILF